MAPSRRRLRWLIITGVGLVVLLVVAVAGIGWYYSSVLLDPARTLDYPDKLAAAGGGTVTLVPSGHTEQAGIWEIDWNGGELQVGATAGNDGDGVVRPVLGGQPPPQAGTAVLMDPTVYGPDPSSRGLAFRDVAVPTPLGIEPAWLVPAERASDTWVVTVHGRGATREESLRILPTLHAAGHPVLAISYRNDVGAPPSPDGLYHLGDTEWQDVEAAVDFAAANGAKRIVLYAWSMGGAIAGAYLDRAPNARLVQAVLLDAPVLDWRAVLLLQTRNRNLPTLLTTVAEWFTSARIGIDFNRFDLITHPPAVRPPTLLFHGSGDTTVPVQPARDLAAAAPSLGWPLQYMEVPGAEHTASWNTDPEAYQRRVAEFLAVSAAQPAG